MLYIIIVAFFYYHQIVASLKDVYFSSARRSSYCISLRAGAILSDCELIMNSTPVFKLGLKYCKIWSLKVLQRLGTEQLLLSQRRILRGFTQLSVFSKSLVCNFALFGCPLMLMVFISDKTLALLEHSLPAHFKGVKHLYYNQLKGVNIVGGIVTNMIFLYF